MHMRGSMGQQWSVCQKGITRYMANQNDGHPSCDHGLKHNISSLDLHWLAQRIVSIQIHQPCSALQGQLSNEIMSTSIGSKLPFGISYQTPDDLQNQVTSLQWSKVDPLVECIGHLSLISTNMVYYPQSSLTQEIELV